jgi:hypothetical protein
MQQVLMPILIMIGATLLVLLAVPLALLAVPGIYYTRRAIGWLIPTAHRFAVKLGQQAGQLRHSLVYGRFPQSLLAGALGCTLALPALAVPVRDLNSGWGLMPRPGSSGSPHAQVGPCCGARVTGPAESPMQNQVREAPPVTSGVVKQAIPVDVCAGSCEQPPPQNAHQSKSRAKLKKKKSKG